MERRSRGILIVTLIILMSLLLEMLAFLPIGKKEELVLKSRVLYSMPPRDVLKELLKEDYKVYVIYSTRGMYSCKNCSEVEEYYKQLAENNSKVVVVILYVEDNPWIEEKELPVVRSISA